MLSSALSSVELHVVQSRPGLPVGVGSSGLDLTRAILGRKYDASHVLSVAHALLAEFELSNNFPMITVLN